MAGDAAVCVDDDLASGEAAIAVGAADDEAAGGIDQVTRVPVEPFRGQHRFDDFLDDRFPHLLQGYVFGVLGGNDDGFDAFRAAVAIAEAELALGVRAQPGQGAFLADFGPVAA